MRISVHKQTDLVRLNVDIHESGRGRVRWYAMAPDAARALAAALLAASDEDVCSDVYLDGDGDVETVERVPLRKCADDWSHREEDGKDAREEDAGDDDEPEAVDGDDRDGDDDDGDEDGDQVPVPGHEDGDDDERREQPAAADDDD